MLSIVDYFRPNRLWRNADGENELATEEESMKKLMKCSKCRCEHPPLTLKLVNPQIYEDSDNIPDIREYDIICVNCNTALNRIYTENTMTGVKCVRDEMDNLYGTSSMMVWV